MRVVAGAGPAGTAVAKSLAEQGERVKVVTRSGSGPEHPNIEKVIADAADPAALTAIANGAETIFSCAGPPYERWPSDWPPLGESLVKTAGNTGAVLLTTGNLYGYGAPTHPMTEQDEDRPNSVKGQVRAKLQYGLTRQSGR